MKNIFKPGAFANLFNTSRTHVFQFGSQLRGKSGVVQQRDAKLGGSGGKNNTEYAINVLRDTTVQQAYDRLLEVMATFRPILEPGGEEPQDEACAEYIKSTYIDRDSIFQTAIESGALSKITGCSAHENNYDRDRDGLIYVRSLTPVDTDRLIYVAKENSSEYTLRIETFKNPIEGELPPSLKIVDFTYYSVYINNPYGFGVGSQLIDVVEYKQRMIELWVRISERYASPIKIARVPNTAEEQEITDFFEHFKKMSEGATFVLPPDFDLEVKDISSTGVSDLLIELIDYADRQICGLILGEYLTGREIANGAQARDKVAAEITNRKALSLLNSIAGRLNETTFKWLTALNFPNAKPPRLRFEAETDLDGLAARLTTLKQLGLDFDEEWLAELFDVQLNTKPPVGFGNKPLNFNTSTTEEEREVEE